MSGQPVPMLERLSPAPLATPPAGFARVTESIRGGLPHRIELGPVTLALIAPTGVAATWRDADPRTPVGSSAEGLASFDPTAAAPTAPASRLPLRLIALHEDRIVASLPLRAGRLRLVAAAGGEGSAALVELVVLGWELHAGTLRGAGDAGSRIDLAWRRADRPEGA
ncbi:MAG TPA: hypothetical protein VF245_06885 [Solirubrobacterales bacterium]